MKKIPISKNGDGHAIFLPQDLDLEGVEEFEVSQLGDNIILRPIRVTLSANGKVDIDELDFMAEVEALSMI